MSSDSFIDHVKIYCRSGDGGRGAVHFLRDKLTSKGGPDGGDGGKGGDIIIRGNRNMWTLLHLTQRKHVKADHGVAGGGNRRFGAYGKNVILEVPPGTVIKDAESGKMVLEITEHSEEKVLLSGGKGGLGNYHFKSSVRQTPRYAQPGEEGIENWFVFELKVMADVGLVGFPNAGKSTLLSVLSAAKPKVADYAFTTLTPSIGIVGVDDKHSFVMADIPGIIEGAHEGRGLGTRFLRHIERNAALLFMVPCDTDDIKADYLTLLNELKLYNPELLDKHKLLAVTKTDMLDEELTTALKADLPDDIDAVFVSSFTGQGLGALKDKLWTLLN
jgi:GTPase